MNDSRTKILICIFLLVSTISVYSQVQDHEFINYDDDIYVTENSIVQAGFTNENIMQVFTKSHFGMWIPITSLSYILDYELYKLNSKGYLLTNLFFHIANSLLLFLILFRITGAIWQSAFVAVMFAFHPLNVESVAWVTQRKNVLSTLFWLLTMWAYINYATKPTVKRYGLIFLFFTLGLMSKPMLVTLPFVLLLLDYWPLRRWKFGQRKGGEKVFYKHKHDRGSEVFQLVLEKIPLFLLAMGLIIVTVLSNNRAFGLQPLDELPLQARVANAMVSYLEYLKKMMWPSDLSILYAHPGNALPVWKGILCGMALVSITIISIRLIRKAPYFAVGWFWYLGTLVPAIGLLKIGPHAMADRYAYISLIGVFIIVAWGVPEFISKWRYKKKILSIAAGIIMMALLITTWEQVSHWKSSITIFQHTIRVTDKVYPNFSIAHNNLGIALFAEQKNEEAISNFRIAIKLKPADSKPHHNLGLALFAEQKNEEAISQYKMAIKLKPNFTSAHYNLGKALFAVNETEKAIFHYKMAIKLQPNLSDVHYNLGYALVQKGDMKEAVHHFRENLKLRPDLVAARDSLEFALLRSRELE
jgi:protein O-mannosyl-transferase